MSITDRLAHDRLQEKVLANSWARLLRRVFGIDLEHCPKCGGDFKIIAAPSTDSGQASRSLR